MLEQHHLLKKIAIGVFRKLHRGGEGGRKGGRGGGRRREGEEGREGEEKGKGGDSNKRSGLQTVLGSSSFVSIHLGSIWTS